MNPTLPNKSCALSRIRKTMMGGERKGGVKRRYNFSKPERIRRNIEYRRTFEQGVSYRNGIFILTISKNEIGLHRLGISISSSKVPFPSTRNRIKRLVREVFRLNKAKLKNGPYDIVVTLKAAPAEGINYSIVEDRLKTLLKKADAL